MRRELCILLCITTSLLVSADDQSLCPLDDSEPDSSSGGDDDTSCVASDLRSMPTSGEQCAYVRANCDDVGAGFFGSYLELFYCGGKGSGAGFVWLLLLVLLLIVILGTTADNFFVPQLEFLSGLLRLPPDVAGITLLALGNGAPDIFTAMAVAQDPQTDFPMLLADLLGASVFISTVVLGSVVLVASRRHATWRVDTIPFWRDLCVYLLALSSVLIIASDGQIVLGEAVAFLGIYAVYISSVLLLPRLKGWREQATRPADAGAATTTATSLLPAAAVATTTASGAAEAAITATPPGPLLASLGEAGTDGEACKSAPLAGLDPPEDFGLGGGLRGASSTAAWLMELPFALARWLSIPSSDGIWDRRRRLLSGFSLPGAAFVLLLEVANLRGDDADDAWQYTVGSMPTWGLALLMPLPLSAILWFGCGDAAPPRAYPLLVVVGFVTVIAWLDLVANEVVAVIQTLGFLLGISTSILGLTVVAIGNSVGDLVADSAVARRGDVRMAVASCFGSPLLNDIIGLGVALTTHISIYGPIQSPISKQCRVAYLFLYPALASSLVAFPCNGYHVSRRFGAYLIMLYAAFMLVSVLVEVSIIPSQALCWWS